MTLPKISDPDDDQYIIDVKLGKASIFVAYNYPILSINPGPTNNGSYAIKIVLTDKNKNPMSTKYNLNINV